MQVILNKNYFEEVKPSSQEIPFLTKTHDYYIYPKELKGYKLPKSKIRNKCFSFFNLKASKMFCAFYSISFPAGLSDEMAYKLFNTWLTRCRKNEKLKSYLWVAERQKNKTLHFHLLTNQYMAIRTVNGYMASALKTQFKNGSIPPEIEAPTKYNGVDVDNLYYSKRRKNHKKRISKAETIKKLSYYITKYVTKNTERFSRLAWHCSRSISNLFTSVCYSEIEDTFLAEQLNLNADKIKMIENEYFNLFILLFDLPEQIFNKMHKANELIYSHIVSGGVLPS
ncbi:rolling circle replication-associated protein [Tenacibaculum piscium]|uniref:rolling circle replication-associated protein n=3 Tax=Tenacibaculum piscium TaxID=1458515 RepID=UPI001F394810|nr:hypothetical protein [Tenacibaculum piscium]